MFRSVIERFQLQRDRWRRRLAIWRWDRPNDRRGPLADRIVFVRWDAKLGDTVVLSWVLREMARQRPELSISVITVAAFEGLFRQGFGIDSVFLTDKRPQWRELKHLAQALVRSRYLVHLGAIWRPRDLYFVSQVNPGTVVGLDDELQMVDVKLGQMTAAAHFSEKLIPWLEDLGIDTRQRTYWVPRHPKAIAAIDRWWPQTTVIGVCPYGASSKRHLSPEQLRFVLSLALADPQFKVLMLVRAEQSDALAQSLADEPWHDRVLFHAADDFFELFEQIARCQALVSVDTATVHIAAGFGKPLLALYADSGPETENFKNWHPNNKSARSQFVRIGQVGFGQQVRRELSQSWQQVIDQVASP